MTERMTAFRKRRADDGLIRLELWVPAERRDEIKAAVQTILDTPTPPAP